MPAPDTLTGLIGRSIDLRAQSAHRREVSIMLMAQTNELMAPRLRSMRIWQLSGSG
jgi:hypothetical protein